GHEPGFQVHREKPVPGRDLAIQDRLPAETAGDVDETVETAELLLDPRGRPSHRRLVGQVHTAERQSQIGLPIPEGGNINADDRPVRPGQNAAGLLTKHARGASDCNHSCHSLLLQAARKPLLTAYKYRSARWPGPAFRRASGPTRTAVPGDA